MEQILIIILYIGGGLIAITFAVLVAIFFIATAMYVIPVKQQKVDLKALSEMRVESRIYLDEYKFIIASDRNQKKIDLQVKTITSLESKSRKAAAQLKSINAAVEHAIKTKIKPQLPSKKEPATTATAKTTRTSKKKPDAVANDTPKNA